MIAMSSTYDENTVLWRLRSPDGLRARATFIPGQPENTLAWFLGETLDRVENHATAIRRQARRRDARRVDGRRVARRRVRRSQKSELRIQKRILTSDFDF
jgi:hypothetical protein